MGLRNELNAVGIAAITAASRKNCGHMIEEIELFRLAAARMDWLAERQGVLAGNIANADTPHFRAQDLSPFSFEGRLGQGAAVAAAPPLRLVRTDAAHFGLPAAATLARIDSHAPTYGEKPDGNTVSLEEQMVKATDVANGFSLASAAYSKSIGLLRIGIDPGR